MAETQDSRGPSRVRGILAQSRAEATQKKQFLKEKHAKTALEQKSDGSLGCRQCAKNRNCAKNLLEAEMRSESDAQIVSGAIKEIYLVANFSSQTKRSPEALDADTRVHREAGIPLIHVAKGLAHSLRAAGEVHKADFASSKEVRFSSAEVELRSKQTVEWTCTSSGERCGRTIAKEIGAVAFEVIRQFAFHAGVGTYIEPSPATNANKVDDIGPVKTVIIDEGADLGMFFCLREESGWRSQQECQHRKHSDTFHKWFSPVSCYPQIRADRPQLTDLRQRVSEKLDAGVLHRVGLETN
jgi:hypothetical protein